jgi:hypothetical protein
MLDTIWGIFVEYFLGYPFTNFLVIDSLSF